MEIINKVEPSVYGWTHCNSGFGGPSFGDLGCSGKLAELLLWSSASIANTAKERWMDETV